MADTISRGKQAKAGLKRRTTGIKNEAEKIAPVGTLVSEIAANIDEDWAREEFGKAAKKTVVRGEVVSVSVEGHEPGHRWFILWETDSAPEPFRKVDVERFE